MDRYKFITGVNDCIFVFGKAWRLVGHLVYVVVNVSKSCLLTFKTIERKGLKIIHSIYIFGEGPSLVYHICSHTGERN